MVRIAWALAALLFWESRAEAVTADDLVALSRAGLSADVLVAVIDADDTQFDLTPEQLIELKAAGLPDQVLIRMLRQRSVQRERSRPESRHAVIAPVLVPLYPVIVVPGFPWRAAPSTWTIGRPEPGFGRFMNDGWIEGKGFGRFMNDGWRTPSSGPVSPPRPQSQRRER